MSMKTLVSMAAARGRTYTTPEDVQDLIDSGAGKMRVWEELLAIIGKQWGMGAEDASLCCYVAWKFKKGRRRR